MTDLIGLFKKVNSLYDLNLELLDVLTTSLVRIREYCDEHNIPLRNEESIYRLITFSRSVMKEIRKVEESIESRKLPPFKFDDRDPEELPESQFL